MINLIYTIFFLVLAIPAASEVSFARLLHENSFAKDRFFGGLEINLSLSQGVPYKISFLEDPISLIIDFYIVSFDEIDPQKLNQEKLYNSGTFQIVGSALNICPENIPKKIKNDYQKKLKQIVKENKK